MTTTTNSAATPLFMSAVAEKPSTASAEGTAVNDIRNIAVIAHVGMIHAILVEFFLCIP